MKVSKWNYPIVLCPPNLFIIRNVYCLTVGGVKVVLTRTRILVILPLLEDFGRTVWCWDYI